MTDAMTGSIRRGGNLLFVTLFLVLILALWTGFSLIPQPEKSDLQGADGFCDLTGKDFEDTIYHYTGDWESYPEKLYTPEDFVVGAVIRAFCRLFVPDRPVCYAHSAPDAPSRSDLRHFPDQFGLFHADFHRRRRD